MERGGMPGWKKARSHVMPKLNAGPENAHAGFKKAYSVTERPSPHLENPCQVSSGSAAPCQSAGPGNVSSLLRGLLIAP